MERPQIILAAAVVVVAAIAGLWFGSEPEPPPLVQVAAQAESAEITVHVAGEVDMATCPQLRQEIVGQIGRGNINLVVDLGDVDFIDSTGLGVLIGGLKRARGHGGDLRVSGVDERLEKVFELTGLGEILLVVSSTNPDETGAQL